MINPKKTFKKPEIKAWFKNPSNVNKIRKIPTEIFNPWSWTFGNKEGSYVLLFIP
jgi:hypothetical protein